MIPSLQEIIYRVFGALYLARFQAQGTAYFEPSPTTALRSFFAAAIVAPAFVISLLLGNYDTPAADAFAVVAAIAASYCLGWTMFPVIAHRICQTLGREKAFFTYLSAKNWGAVVTVHLSLVITVLAAGGALPEALLPLLDLTLFVYVMAFQWFITWKTLSLSIPGAIGFVALDTVIDYFIASIVYGIIY